MEDKDKINELVEMLDKFMASGGGHMNVEVEDASNLEDINIQTTSSNCCGKNMACQVPTIHQGIDDDEQNQ